MKVASTFLISALVAGCMGNLAELAVSPMPANHQYHVSVHGNDADAGSAESPLKTISAAAQLARPGDTITVHEGTYRERINPPRGGVSKDKRIVYQAAPGEKVEIKGSEVIKGWKPVRNGVWKVTLPNRFFGKFNPYDDLVSGNWFRPRDRNHHTGTVYLNGDWLIEAATVEEVLKPIGAAGLSNARMKLVELLRLSEAVAGLKRSLGSFPDGPAPSP